MPVRDIELPFTEPLRPGAMVGPYQVVDEAPLEFIRGSRTRVVYSGPGDMYGRMAAGSWSAPWWAYAPGPGWALIRRWRCKASPAHRWSSGNPALDLLIITPYAQIEEIAA